MDGARAALASDQVFSVASVQPRPKRGRWDQSLGEAALCGTNDLEIASIKGRKRGDGR